MVKYVLAAAIALFAYLPLEAQVVAAADSSIRWKWVEEKNPMTDVVTKYIKLTADSAAGPASAEKPWILIDCDTATMKPSLTIVTNSGLDRSPRNSAMVDFRVRLDQAPAVDASWISTYQKLYAYEVSDYFIRQLLKSSRLLVEIPMKNGIRRLMTFSTGGLAPFLEKLEPVCKR